MCYNQLWCVCILTDKKILGVLYNPNDSHLFQLCRFQRLICKRNQWCSSCPLYCRNTENGLNYAQLIRCALNGQMLNATLNATLSVTINERQQFMDIMVSKKYFKKDIWFSPHKTRNFLLTFSLLMDAPICSLTGNWKEIW